MRNHMAITQKINEWRSYLPLQRCMAGEDIRRLSDGDLLSIVLGTGTASRNVVELAALLLVEFGGLQGIARSGVRELIRVPGIAQMRALRIHAAIEMGRRAMGSLPHNGSIDTPEKVWRLLLADLAGLQQEHFCILVLNHRNHLLKKSVISVGTVSEALVHPREVFRDAIKEGGSGIIVAHNHPTGELLPSKEDIRSTERLREAGEVVGITLLDHVIISSSAYFSLKEAGYIQ